MDLNKIFAISGKPGLFQVVTQRTNGFIVRSLVSGKTNFISLRTHAFSALGNISIYTMADATLLKDVLKSIHEKNEAGTTTPPDPKSEGSVLHAYMKEILPEYDEDRVYNSDIKKLIKWYNLLKEKDMLDFSEPEEEEKAEEGTEAKEEGVEAAEEKAEEKTEEK